MGILSSIRARLRNRDDRDAWFGLAGHGLRLTPRCPVQIQQREDGTLDIGRDHDGGLVTLVPGSRAAREAARALRAYDGVPIRRSIQGESSAQALSRRAKAAC